MDKIISVVIPTFDRQALTDRAVESVSPSRPELFEIIVVDDCGTIPYERKQSSNSHGVPVLFIRTPANAGPGLARELGVEKATGSVIAFLDSDDVFENGWPDAILSEIGTQERSHWDELFIAADAVRGSEVQRFAARVLARSPGWAQTVCVRLVAIAFNPFYTPATAISKKLCAFTTMGRYCEDYFTNALAIFGARRIIVLPMAACTISRSPGELGGMSEHQHEMLKGEFAVRRNMLFARSIPLRYRALVPLGMLYAATRNTVKFLSTKLRPSPSRSNPTIRKSRSGGEDERQPLASRIAILGTRGIPARYGGFETFAEKLADGLTESGFDVTVYCEAGESPMPDLHRGVKLHYVSAPRLGSLQTILYDLRCLWAARKKYDVVYMLGYGVAPFCVIPRLWKTEVWINPDGLEWARAKWGPVAKAYFRLMEWSCLYSANRIIADAEAIAASLASRHGRISDCTVIPYGCEVVEQPPTTKPLTEWSIEPGRYYLIVCRLEPENHVLEILHGFQKSRSSRKLVVVGNFKSGNRYTASLCAVDDPRVDMIGTVYDQAKLTCLRYHSFAYMHGHSVGGTNPSLLEAMGCGNLIFAHDNPFNRETLGPYGLFFANESELATAIDEAEQREGDLDRLREASRLRARARYRWEDIISRYAALLKSAASANRRGL